MQGADSSNAVRMIEMRADNEKMSTWDRPACVLSSFACMQRSVCNY